MTSRERSHFRNKHSIERRPKIEVEQAVNDKAKKEGLSCAVAFSLAKELDVPPAEVGFTADFLEISIVKCQLGLFGYGLEKRKVKPAEAVTPSLEQAIGQALTNGRLTCAAAWEIAEKYRISKMEVSSACETMGIKISSCQLGTF